LPAKSFITQHPQQNYVVRQTEKCSLEMEFPLKFILLYTGNGMPPRFSNSIILLVVIIAIAVFNKELHWQSAFTTARYE
jgi:hypothetical protein